MDNNDEQKPQSHVRVFGEKFESDTIKPHAYGAVRMDATGNMVFIQTDENFKPLNQDETHG